MWQFKSTRNILLGKMQPEGHSLYLPGMVYVGNNTYTAYISEETSFHLCHTVVLVRPVAQQFKFKDLRNHHVIKRYGAPPSPRLNRRPPENLFSCLFYIQCTNLTKMVLISEMSRPVLAVWTYTLNAFTVHLILTSYLTSNTF